MLNDTYTLNLSQDNKYVFSINNLTEVPNNDYIFTKTDNSFSITNLRQNKKPIIIDYKSLDGTDIGQYTVYLGGISIE